MIIECDCRDLENRMGVKRKLSNPWLYFACALYRAGCYAALYSLIFMNPLPTCLRKHHIAASWILPGYSMVSFMPTALSAEAPAFYCLGNLVLGSLT